MGEVLMKKEEKSLNALKKGKNGKFSLTYGNVLLFRDLYKNNKSQGVEFLNNFNFRDNCEKWVVEVYSKYIGMPEFEILRNDEDFYEDVKTTAFTSLIETLLTIDLKKCEEKRTKSSNVALHTYIHVNMKHALTLLMVEKAKFYYPSMSRHYLENRLLAYKGGITGYIRNYSEKEIYDAIAETNAVNHERSLQKNKVKGGNPRKVHLNYEKMINAFSLGCYKEIADEDSCNHKMNILVESISNEKFKKDQLARFVFYRMANKLPLNSTNKEVKAIFSKNGYSSTSSISSKISELKKEVKAILQEEYGYLLKAEIFENTSSKPKKKEFFSDGIDFVATINSPVRIKDMLR